MTTELLFEGEDKFIIGPDIPTFFHSATGATVVSEDGQSLIVSGFNNNPHVDDPNKPEELTKMLKLTCSNR